MRASAWVASTVAAYILAAAVAPLSARRPLIAIDVGHNGVRPGAISSRGLPEYGFNRRVAFATRDALTRAGLEAFVIDDAAGVLPLTGRTAVATRQGAAFLISIHHDSVQRRYLGQWTDGRNIRHYCDWFKGYSLFISNKNPFPERSCQVATLIGRALRGAGLSPSLHHAEAVAGESRPLLDPGLGLFRFDDLIVLKSAKVPAVLVECGIIVNRDEELELGGDARISAVAGAITAALLEAEKGGLLQSPALSKR